MKKTLTLVCLGLAACDGGLHGDRRLQRGMTEQEVTQLQGKQAPDRIIMRTCGTATPNPFPCKVHVYRRGLWCGECRRLRGRARKMGGEPVALNPTLSAVQKKTEAAGECSLRLPLSPPCDSARVCGRCLTPPKQRVNGKPLRPAKGQRDPQVITGQQRRDLIRVATDE